MTRIIYFADKQVKKKKNLCHPRHLRLRNGFHEYRNSILLDYKILSAYLFSIDYSTNVGNKIITHKRLNKK